MSRPGRRTDAECRCRSSSDRPYSCGDADVHRTGRRQADGGLGGTTGAVTGQPFGPASIVSIARALAGSDSRWSPRSKIRPSGTRINRTGVPHSMSLLRSASIATRAAARLASTGEARRERLIEAAREHDRGFVTNFELHRDHCRDVMPNERSCYTGKRVRPCLSGALTSVENRQAQRGEVVQDHPQLVAAHGLCRATVVLEQEDAPLRLAVARPVSDVMQCMERLGLKRLQNRSERRPLNPLELDRARLAQSRMARWRFSRSRSTSSCSCSAGLLMTPSSRSGGSTSRGRCARGRSRYRTTGVNADRARKSGSSEQTPKERRSVQASR